MALVWVCYYRHHLEDEINSRKSSLSKRCTSFLGLINYYMQSKSLETAPTVPGYLALMPFKVCGNTPNTPFRTLIKHHLQSSNSNHSTLTSFHHSCRYHDLCKPDMLLGSWEIANAQVPVVTKTHAARVLMIFKWCNLGYWLKKVTACTCYMHITVQQSVGLQQEQSCDFLIVGCKGKVGFPVHATK